MIKPDGYGTKDHGDNEAAQCKLQTPRFGNYHQEARYPSPSRFNFWSQVSLPLPHSPENIGYKHIDFAQLR